MIYPIAKKCFLYSILIIFLIMQPSITSEVRAHGGKTHTGNEFSPLDVLKKGTSMFEALLKQKKIDMAWGIHLETVVISSEKTNKGEDFRVEFTRNTGEPKTLFLFFNESGDYTGSNFKKN